MYSCTNWTSLVETSSPFVEESLGLGVGQKLVIANFSASVFSPDKGGWTQIINPASHAPLFYVSHWRSGNIARMKTMPV